MRRVVSLSGSASEMAVDFGKLDQKRRAMRA